MIIFYAIATALMAIALLKQSADKVYSLVCLLAFFSFVSFWPLYLSDISQTNYYLYDSIRIACLVVVCYIFSIGRNVLPFIVYAVTLTLQLWLVWLHFSHYSPLIDFAYLFLGCVEVALFIYGLVKCERAKNGNIYHNSNRIDNAWRVNGGCCESVEAIAK